MTDLAGHLDECNWEVLRGWLRSGSQPDERVRFDVLIDNEVVFTGLADELGTDLAEAGMGDGCFRFTVPLGNFTQLHIGGLHDITVREHHSAQPMFHSRLTRWNAQALAGSSLADTFAARYLSGVGLEIGALHRPQKLPAGARVRHVDLLSTSELKQRYAEVPAEDIVEVEIIDDGATLARVADQSADFLIANNVIEHVQDPVATLASWHRVVKPGGVLFVLVPNPRNSIDHKRARTTAEHVTADHERGSEHSRTDHYREWVTSVERRPEHEVQARVEQLETQNYPIHFHVWDELGCADLVRATMTLTGKRFAVEHLALTENRIDTLLILRVE